MIIQYTIVAVVFFASLIWILKRMMKSLNNKKGGCTKACGCANVASDKTN